MKTTSIYIILVIQLSFFACQNSYPDINELRKLSRAEIIDFEKQGKELFNEDLIWHKKRKPSPEELQLIAKGELYYDIFVDKENRVQLLNLHPASYHNNITEILRKNVGFSPHIDNLSIDFDCENITKQLEEVGLYRERSNLVRNQIKDSLTLDSLERDGLRFSNILITSVEEKCGFEFLNNKCTRRIWSEIHHNEKEILAYYYSYVEEQTKIGKLHPERLALLTDRLLMYNDYEQVYGTQISNSELYPIRNVDSVNIRRAEIGLPSMAEYLEGFALKDTSSEFYKKVVSLDIEQPKD